MKLRVLACAFACSPGAAMGRFGGGEQILGWNVVRQLSRFHQVWVLTSTRNRAAIEVARESETLPNVHFCYLDLARWLEPLQSYAGGIQCYAYFWQVKAYFAARRLHKKIRFDGFHHITYANDWMASFIGALLPVPYIRGPGGGAHRTPKPFLREYPHRSRVWEQWRAVGQWLFRHDPFFIAGQRQARAILACNYEALEAIPRKWQHKAQLFPVNGVSSTELSLAPLEGPDSVENGPERQGEKFSILSAGKLLPLKGIGLAIKAFKAFVDRAAATERAREAKFRIIGDGPELPRLEALVHQLGLQTQVRFEKGMAREELLLKMHSCDVFLFPSLRDGGGAVVVEAMAAGKAVICLDLAGPAMHVTHDCGIKITAESPEQVVDEMAAALERLWQDKPLRSRMGKAGRERAERVYHWDVLGEHLRVIYEQALGSQLTQR